MITTADILDVHATEFVFTVDTRNGRFPVTIVADTLHDAIAQLPDGFWQLQSESPAIV